MPPPPQSMFDDVYTIEIGLLVVEVAFVAIDKNELAVIVSTPIRTAFCSVYRSAIIMTIAARLSAHTTIIMWNSDRIFDIEIGFSLAYICINRCKLRV